MKTIKKVLSAVTAAVLCALPIVNGTVANAASSSQMKTYVVYCVATRPDIACFDFTLNYGSDVIVEKSTPTSLLSKGYFSSNLKSGRIQNTYCGPAIGSTGKLISMKFIVPMDTESIFDKVTYSNIVVHNASGVTLPSTSIVCEAVLLGDVDQNGVVNEDDALLIMRHIGNPDNYHITEKGLDAGDVYSRGDGLTNMDAVTIQQYVDGEILCF